MEIENILFAGETLFKNLNVFDLDYLPSNYNFREDQMEGLAIAIRPIFKNSRPINAVILGQCATGKTTAIKKIFEIVEGNKDDVVCCYINCQLHNTLYGIFSKIHKEVVGIEPPVSGLSLTKLYQIIAEQLKKKKLSLIVAFDDINYLLNEVDVNKIFYDLLRVNEEYDDVKTGVFAILSDIEFRFKLEKNVDTVFSPHEILFPPYSYNEIYDILLDRVNSGFYTNVISDELLDDITNHTYESGDLRVGINLLKVAGNIAESNGSRYIEDEHVDEAIAKNISFNLKQSLKSLSEDEMELIRLIAREDKVLNAKNLFDDFNKKTGLKYHKFNSILDKLEFLRLIDIKFTGKGTRGNSRQIILRFSVEDINKCHL
ncbi:MAG: ORC1-type DNA replication protein [Methanobrevibacter sp.]|jgi:cell division control protein 6|nr:ORC1-type DNA replication protein [Candidatus Methanovirga basalitermitum]